MKSIVGIIAVFLVIIAISMVANHTLYKGKEMCIAGKLYAPCDSWMMKWQPLKIHMGKQK